jgi:hypothetical protein
MIRIEEALLILKKWQDERTPLRVSAHLSDGIFNFDCFIVRFSENSVVVQLAKDPDQCEFRISDFGIEYGEPRGTDEAEQKLAGHRYRSTLVFVRTNNEHIAFMEIVT